VGSTPPFQGGGGGGVANSDDRPEKLWHSDYSVHVRIKDHPHTNEAWWWIKTKNHLKVLSL
jgi:hypothetical protein